MRKQISPRRTLALELRLRLDQFRQTFKPELDVAKQLGREIFRPQLAFAQVFPLPGGVFARRYRRMTRRSFIAWPAVTSRSSRFPSAPLGKTAALMPPPIPARPLD